MDTNLERAITKLERNALLRFPDGQGKCVAVFDGHVWITQESDTRDVVLGPGDSFGLDRRGLAIVQALDDAKVLVFDGVPSRRAEPVGLRPGQP